MNRKYDNMYLSRKLEENKKGNIQFCRIECLPMVFHSFIRMSVIFLFQLPLNKEEI